jgi:hypothetical protein
MTNPSSNTEDEGGLASGGSGDGGTLGTPTSDTKETPPGHDQDSTMVVSGGGLADTSADDGGSS